MSNNEPISKIDKEMKKLQSRQITRPLIGKYIERIASDQLHNGNNTVQNNWICILRLLISLVPKEFDGKPIIQLPKDCPLRVLLTLLKGEKAGKASDQLYNSSIQGSYIS